MLQQAYGEDALKRRTVFKWVQCYWEGRKDPTNNNRSGHSSSLCSDKNIDRIQVALPESTTLFKGLKEDDFQGYYNQWKRRWDKCIASEGENFEGDQNNVPNNT
jgi:hypothetical protein